MNNNNKMDNQLSIKKNISNNPEEVVLTNKNKLMKIILPIKLSNIIKRYIRKQTYVNVYKNLKYITFISHCISINNIYEKSNIRYVFNKLKKITFLFYKLYYINNHEVIENNSSNK